MRRAFQTKWPLCFPSVLEIEIKTFLSFFFVIRAMHAERLNQDSDFDNWT
jgi:hypothetical protein